MFPDLKQRTRRAHLSVWVVWGARALSYSAWEDRRARGVQVLGELGSKACSALRAKSGYPVVENGGVRAQEAGVQDDSLSPGTL